MSPTDPACEAQSAHAHRCANYQVVAEETVVTRDRNGHPCSLFRDDIWNIGAYGKNHLSRSIYFRNLSPVHADVGIAQLSKVQTKQVMYFLMHHASDDMPSPSTLVMNINVLRAFSVFATSRQQTLYQGLADVQTVSEFARQDKSHEINRRLHAVLAHLHRLGRSMTGVEVPLLKLKQPLMNRSPVRPDYAQHPVIPTRIYQHFLSVCETELKIAEAAADDLIMEIGRAYAGMATCATPSPKLLALLHCFGLRPHGKHIVRAVTEVRVLCQLLILAFTGMRSAEVRSLPFNCLRVFHQDGVRHYAVEGITTKLSGGRASRATWVTSHLAARAISLAQRLSGEAHRRFGQEGYAVSSDGTHLLFCKMGLLNERYELERGFTVRYISEFRQRAFLHITEEDIAELKQVDAFRAWESEPKFALGLQWPFTRHQLRRTLALYAHRSGLVTLPSLKRQLQHITQEMSMYYARGSAFAKNLFGDDKDHFSHSWCEAQGLSEYLAYRSLVLSSKERVFGGHGAWATSGPVRQSPVSVYSREETILMFNRGELAFKETALGGCASTSACKASPLNWFDLECLLSDCKNLVIIPSKLQRAIKAQKRQVAALGALAGESVEFRLEVATLETLLAAREKIIKTERK